jgi:hypothetical protein
VENSKQIKISIDRLLKNSHNHGMIKYNNSRLCPPSENGILNVRRIPARIDSRMTATILGFQEHDIPVLVSAGFLSPLGKPVQNSTKYFARCDIDASAENPKWLWKATQVVYDHWKIKNNSKKVQRDSGGESIPKFPEGQGTSFSE